MPKFMTYHRPAPINRPPRQAARITGPFGKHGGKAPKPAPDSGGSAPGLPRPGFRPPKR